MKAFIVGSGVHVPERVVTNEEIADSLGVDPEYIFKQSGIRRRRWAAKGVTTSSLAARALRLALEDAGCLPQDVDYLLLGTMTPDRFVPGSASAVQKEVGLPEIPCLDIRAACCNALYGLQLARALIAGGEARNVAICLADIQSPWLEMTPEAGTTSMLFGDGASALIVSAESKTAALEIVDVMLATDGSYLDDLGVRCPGTEFGNGARNQDSADVTDFFPRMMGQSVILQASRRISAICRSVLDRNSITIDDIHWIVPHQANANLLTMVARTLRFSNPNGGVVSVLEDYANTSSASMGMALDSLRRSGAIQPGQLILLPAFGAGFTWGAGLCRS